MDIKNSQGISLLQTVISMGLVGGLLLIVTQTSTIVSNIGIQGSESTDMEIFIGELRKRLTSTSACQNAIGTGIDIENPVEGNSYEVVQIKKTASTNIYEKDVTEKFGKIKIDKIEYEIPVGTLTDLGGDKYSIKGNLRVRMKRRTGGSLDRIIPIDLNLDNAKDPLVDNITSCSAGLSGELDTLIAACKLLDGTVTSTEPFNCDSDMSGGGIIWY